MSDLPEEIVATPEELSACCADLSRHPHFGFDTEFVGEDSYHPRLCLVQAAAPIDFFSSTRFRRGRSTPSGVSSWTPAASSSSTPAGRKCGCAASESA